MRLLVQIQLILDLVAEERHVYLVKNLQTLSTNSCIVAR